MTTADEPITYDELIQQIDDQATLIHQIRRRYEGIPFSCTQIGQLFQLIVEEERAYSKLLTQRRHMAEKRGVWA